MQAALACLARLQGQPLDCVVHIGAGSAALDDHARLETRQLVLVEADPDTLVDLKERVDASRRAHGVRIVGEFVAPRPGSLTWHRYNLRSLNGPLDARGLTPIYPRLRLESTVPMAGKALADVLAAIEPAGRTECEGEGEGEGEGAKVLILDVPGQEDALLASLDAGQVQAFDWIVLRGCAQAPAEGWSPAARAVERLQGGFHRPVDTGAEADPLWPVSLHRFDRKAFEHQRLRERLQRAEDRVAAVEASAAQSRAAAEATTVELLQARAELDLVRESAALAANELAQRNAWLEQALEEQRLLAQEHHAQRAQALQSLAEQADRAAEREQQFEALGRSHDELEQATARLRDELDSRAQALAAAEQAATEATARVGQLTLALDEQQGLAQDRQAQLEQALHARREQESQAAEWQRRLVDAERARDEQVERAAERLQQVDTLTQTAEALRQDAAAMQARVETLVEARAAAEQTAAEGASRVEQLERSLDEQTRLAQGRRTQLDAALHAPQEQEAMAAALKEQLRDALNARDEQATQLRSREQALETLTADLHVQQGEARRLAAELEAAQAKRTALAAERDALAAGRKEEAQAIGRELADARKTAALSVKLQMLRENDLRDLQGRYEAVQTEKQHQHELLSRLAQRLSVANQYFHQLSLEQQRDDLVEDGGPERAR